MSKAAVKGYSADDIFQEAVPPLTKNRGQYPHYHYYIPKYSIQGFDGDEILS
jgi:hypothetical protein